MRNKEGLSCEEAVLEAKEIINAVNRAKNIIDREEKPREYFPITNIITFVVGEVREWQLQAGQHGWLLFPLVDEVYTKEGILHGQVEIVASTELEAPPKVNDLVVIERALTSRFRKRIQIFPGEKNDL